jgi:branched-chain amino acid transport system permease protein
VATADEPGTVCAPSPAGAHLQILVNGMISGAAVALMATAFQAVYLPTRVFFVGLAGVYTLAPFVAYSVTTLGGGFMLAVAAALLACIGTSVLCEWGNHARLARREASGSAHLLASLGIYIASVQAIAMIWGNNAKTLKSGIDVTMQLGGVVVTGAQALTFGVALTLLLVFATALHWTGLGLRLRALADNPVQFALLGYDINRHRMMAFAVGGLLAAVGSLVVAYDIGFDPFVGLEALLLAVVAVIVGGRDSFVSPALAAVLNGMIRAQIVWNFGAKWQDVATFMILVVCLFMRPDGLLGQRRRLEARP